MNGQKLYEIWVNAMGYCQSDPFDDWTELNVAVQHAWDHIAERAAAIIEKSLEGGS